MSKSKLCTHDFPYLNPNIHGRCDECGGAFFDQRDYLPLETVTRWEFGKGEETKILATKANKEAMEYNHKLYEKWKMEHATDVRSESPHGTKDEVNMGASNEHQ